VLRSLRTMRAQGKAKDRSYHWVQTFTKQHHWELWMLISSSYSGI